MHSGVCGVLKMADVPIRDKTSNIYNNILTNCLKPITSLEQQSNSSWAVTMVKPNSSNSQ